MFRHMWTIDRDLNNWVLVGNNNEFSLPIIKKSVRPLKKTQWYVMGRSHAGNCNKYYVFTFKLKSINSESAFFGRPIKLM